jgi:hypothetical protein
MQAAGRREKQSGMNSSRKTSHRHAARRSSQFAASSQFKTSQFKASQSYTWEDEPLERPSEFAASTSHAPLSDYPSGHQSGYSSGPRSTLRTPREPARRVPARGGSAGLGARAMLVFALLLLVAGGWAIVEFLPQLRH